MIRIGSGIQVFLAAGLISGCAFSQKGDDGSDDWDDPFHETFRGANEIYVESPFLEIPTGIGNVLFATASAHLWGLVGLVEDVTRGDERHPIARAIAASFAYAGGAVLGSPFVALYWGLFAWWWNLVSGPGASSPREEAAPPPEGHEPEGE